jgi:hypothetical protein
MKTTIAANELAAVAIASAKKDHRYYLKGVHVAAADNLMQYTATDGHRIHRFACCDHYGAWTAVIIPIDAVDQITKGAKGQVITIEQSDRMVTLTRADGLAVTCAAVDGTFPDVDRVIPKSVSGETAQFNPALLADVSKALKLLTGKALHGHVHHNGNSPAVIGCSQAPQFGALVMPMRLDEHYPSCFVPSVKQEAA